MPKPENRALELQAALTGHTRPTLRQLRDIYVMSLDNHTLFSDQGATRVALALVNAELARRSEHHMTKRTINLPFTPEQVRDGTARQPIERIHPESYRQLRDLIRLHGLPRILVAAREIEAALAKE